MKEKPFTVKEVAKIIGICEQNVRAKLKKGRFPNAYKLGTVWSISKDDIDFYVSKLGGKQ